jgi:hypothetical protein
MAGILHLERGADVPIDVQKYGEVFCPELSVL